MGSCDNRKVTRVLVVLIVVVALVVVGCGRSHRLALSADGRAVSSDASDGHLDRDWTCGSLRAALTRLPSGGGPIYSTLPEMIGRAAGEACDAGLKSLHAGMTAAAVQTMLGTPDTRGRCWLLRWPPADLGQGRLYNPSRRASPVDGARVCFNDGHVLKVQTAIHG